MVGASLLLSELCVVERVVEPPQQGGAFERDGNELLRICVRPVESGLWVVEDF